jgi:hypothetical protein
MMSGMSQPQDPFDPADAAPATPAVWPPPLPVRVQPLGGPLSVLPYTQPATNVRPGLVTAMGVASLIIGVIAMLGGAFTTLISLSFFIASTAGPRTAAFIDPMGPNGYDRSDRRTIVQAMNFKQKMNSAQRGQLDFFIADVGKLYVPAVPITSPTNDPVADWGTANVVASGPNVEGGEWFDLPMGKLTVTDKSASIQLSDGKTISRSTLRTGANPAVLTPQEVGAVVNRIQEMNTTTPLTPLEVSALTSILQSNTGPLFGTPRDMPALLGQISSVVNTGGTTYVTFQNGGVVTVSSGGATVTAGGINTPNGPFKLASAPAAIVVIENILSVGLSIYLLVIGILTLRNSPAGAKLHKVYAWLKLLLAVTGAGGLFWLILGSGGTAPWAWVSGIMVLVIGIIYPIVLLLILPTKSMREWYSVEHVNH